MNIIPNTWKDLAHTYEKFIAPLPNTLQEFKSSISGMFGRWDCVKSFLFRDTRLIDVRYTSIFDTKYLFHASGIEVGGLCCASNKIKS